jgi:hypothetical protein
MTTTDFLTGTVKGPGEMPHEYFFVQVFVFMDLFRPIFDD